MRVLFLNMFNLHTGMRQNVTYSWRNLVRRVRPTVKKIRLEKGKLKRDLRPRLLHLRGEPLSPHTKPTSISKTGNFKRFFNE